MRADVFCLFFFSLTTVPPPMKFYYFRFFLVSFYIIAFCLFMFKLELVLPLHVDFCCNDQFFFSFYFPFNSSHQNARNFIWFCLFVCCVSVSEKGFNIQVVVIWYFVTVFFCFGEFHCR